MGNEHIRAREYLRLIDRSICRKALGQRRVQLGFHMIAAGQYDVYIHILERRDAAAVKIGSIVDDRAHGDVYQRTLMGLVGFHGGEQAGTGK